MSAPRRVWIFINGILGCPGAHDGWTDRAVTWMHTRTPDRAEKWEYAAGPILRRLGQQERAEKIATLMRYYEDAGFELILVGHSNGCDIIARVLDLRGTAPWYFAGRIRSAHLISAAADLADFQSAIEKNALGTLHLYKASLDMSLVLGRWTRRLLGWAGLGYGSLGLPDEDGDLLPPDRVTCTFNHTYGHSDWFTRGENFERTMLLLQDTEAALP